MVLCSMPSTGGKQMRRVWVQSSIFPCSSIPGQTLHHKDLGERYSNSKAELKDLPAIVGDVATLL